MSTWGRLGCLVAIVALAVAVLTPGAQRNTAVSGERTFALDLDRACSLGSLLHLEVAGPCPERMKPPAPPSDRVLGVRVQQTDPPLDGIPTGMPAVGVQFHALWSDYTDQDRVAVLDKLAAAGVTWVRIDLGWQSLQEVSGSAYSQWYVDLADETIDMARQRGISVLATLWATPAWANQGAGRHVPPTDVGDFARVARWAAEHFNGRVAAWEVWNEPNHPSFWSGTAADYTELLKAAYPAFKAGAPTTPVVLGGPSYNDTDWLAEMYEAGGQGSFDVMATHPYQGESDAPPEAPDDGTVWRLNHVAAVHALMQRHGDGDKEIWFTELGWSSHSNTGAEKPWSMGVTEEQQADFLVRTIKHVGANFPYVTKIFWYSERNRQSGKVHLDNYGLLNRDLTAKPAYTALREFLTGGLLPEAQVPAIVPPAPLLANGGFEAGLSGWRAFNGNASTTSASRRGTWAAKVARRRDSFGIASSPVRAPVAPLMRAEGFLRATRPGQPVRLLVTERVDGVVVGRKTVRTKVGRRWEAIPTLEYKLSGAPGATLQIGISSNGQKDDVVFVDDVSLLVAR